MHNSFAAAVDDGLYELQKQGQRRDAAQDPARDRSTEGAE